MKKLILLSLITASLMASSKGGPIELFKPFTFSDNLDIVLQKVKGLPGITSATINCSGSDVNILELKDETLKKDVENIIKESLPTEEDTSDDTFSFLDQAGQVQKGAQVSCTVSASPLIIDNAEYDLEIQMNSEQGAAVIYPDNIIHMSNLSIPLYISGLKFEAKDRTSKNVLNSNVSVNIYNKYKYLNPKVMGMRGMIFHVDIDDKYGHQIELTNNVSVAPKNTLVSGYIEYKMDEQYLKNVYEDRVAKFRQKAGKNINMSNNF
jgi:hypothetical protein